MSKHRQQIEAGVAASLRKAGIRDRYHFKTLTSLAADGHQLAANSLEWFNANHAEPGRSAVFIGNHEHEDMAILVSKAFHMSGRSAYVSRLLRFLELMSEDRQYLEDRIENVEVLTLIQAGPNRAGENVFTDREIRRLEGRLDDWLADGRRLILHCQMHPVWFSADFLQRVAAASGNTRVVE